MLEEEVNRLKRKVGELTMDLDILREAAKRPTVPGTSDECVISGQAADNFVSIR